MPFDGVHMGRYARQDAAQEGCHEDNKGKFWWPPQDHPAPFILFSLFPFCLKSDKLKNCAQAPRPWLFTNLMDHSSIAQGSACLFFFGFA